MTGFKASHKIDLCGEYHAAIIAPNTSTFAAVPEFIITQILSLGVVLQKS